MDVVERKYSYSGKERVGTRETYKYEKEQKFNIATIALENRNPLQKSIYYATFSDDISNITKDHRLQICLIGTISKN